MKIASFKKSKSGFTLIEFAIVLVLAAILASVAMPIYLGFTDGAKWSEAKTATSMLKRTVETYSAKFGDDISGLVEADGTALSFAKLKISPNAFTTLQFFDAGDIQFSWETDGKDGDFVIQVDASTVVGGGLSGVGPRTGIGFYRSLDNSWNGQMR